MRPRQAATPVQLRTEAADIANLLTASSARHARAGEATTAVACQWVADVYRVAGALWATAGASPDPHQEFFQLAERVLTAADRVQIVESACALDVLTELRGAFADACAPVNVLVVFPAATHLASLSTPVQLGALRSQLLGGVEPADFVRGRLEAARSSAGVGALRFALDAYLVDVAEHAGDVMMLTAAARIVALNDGAPRDTADLDTLTMTARRVLGAIEWVRLQPYLTGSVAA